MLLLSLRNKVTSSTFKNQKKEDLCQKHMRTTFYTSQAHSNTSRQSERVDHRERRNGTHKDWDGCDMMAMSSLMYIRIVHSECGILHSSTWSSDVVMSNLIQCSISVSRFIVQRSNKQRTSGCCILHTALDSVFGLHY